MEGPNIHLSQYPARCHYISPRAVHLREACGGHLPPTDRLTRRTTVMAIKRRPSHTDEAEIQILA